jgi:2-dehydro-3-deoxy-D-arabinonate dehydratase
MDPWQRVCYKLEAAILQGPSFAQPHDTMKICRFHSAGDEARIGLFVDDDVLVDLRPAGVTSLQTLLESADPIAELNRLNTAGLPRFSAREVRFWAPVEQQEVWAAGVTYLRSRRARMEESDFSAVAYDKVYSGERPELFFKSMPGKVVSTGDRVGIRKDAKWSVPEPELALVLNSRGAIVGHTIGNDMSSRDIEGENLLYLPQAKVYNRSCALGPGIVLGTPESLAREWVIRMMIRRGGTVVFSGETSVNRIRRGFAELAECLFRSQSFPHGAILLTGTGIVPDDQFTLQAGDQIGIEISGIGRLENEVMTV